LDTNVEVLLGVTVITGGSPNYVQPD
jgi:hypothetical protein